MNKPLVFISLGLLLLSTYSCNTDDLDDLTSFTEEVEEISIPPEEIMTYPYTGEVGDILIHDQSKSQKGYVLVNDPGSDRAYLMSKDSANVVFEWPLEYALGNDAELLSDGRLLASLGVVDPVFSFGGFGGKVQLLNPDGSISWDYDVATENMLGHHDVEMLPNGNILIIIWDARTLEEAIEVGYKGNEEYIYTERIIEVRPSTNEIVWQWDSWEHLIQDYDQNKANFGLINEAPHRIDINYVDENRKEIARDGDIMHANGMDYDAVNDVIYLSVNFYSEVWVIDHSTSLAEAATSTGGNYNKGGDLIYRFGNPLAYKNTEGTRRFFSNHFPNILEDGEPGTGNMLIFVNGNGGTLQSRVFELSLPEELKLLQDVDNEPEVIWEFTHEDLFSPKVSGAVRLPNGNTLITSGVYGFWEVTSNGEIVWQFKGNGFYWRGYHYPFESPAVEALGL